MDYPYGTGFGTDQIGSNDVLNVFNDPHMAVPDIMRSQNRAASRYSRPDTPEHSANGGVPYMLRKQQLAANNTTVRRMGPAPDCVGHYDQSEFYHKNLDNIEKEPTVLPNTWHGRSDAMRGNMSPTDQDNIFYILILISIITIVMNVRTMKKLSKSIKSIKKKIKESTCEKENP
jgi:hypothetical protein